MSELHNIPLIYKAGAYSLAGFSRDIDDDDAISLDYDAQYQMLTYDIPVGEDWRGMTLYNVSEDDLIRTLRAVYGKDGALQNITAILGGHETLLYIRYENKEHARQEIRSFAVRNADAIIEQIRQCTDVVARLFIEYYCDSDNMDYHAVIGTADQVEAVRQKYRDEDSCDCAGNYPSENIEGNNRMLLQKTVSTGAVQIENNGLMERYLYTGSHEAIISDEMFMAVQQEKLSRFKEPQNHIAMKLSL